MPTLYNSYFLTYLVVALIADIIGIIMFFVANKIRDKTTNGDKSLIYVILCAIIYVIKVLCFLPAFFACCVIIFIIYLIYLLICSIAKKIIKKG